MSVSFPIFNLPNVTGSMCFMNAIHHMLAELSYVFPNLETVSVKADRATAFKAKSLLNVLTEAHNPSPSVDVGRKLIRIATLMGADPFTIGNANDYFNALYKSVLHLVPCIGYGMPDADIARLYHVVAITDTINIPGYQLFSVILHTDNHYICATHGPSVGIPGKWIVNNDLLPRNEVTIVDKNINGNLELGCFVKTK